MNIQNLLKQAQQMQNNVKKVEKELDGTVYTGTSGGEAVKVQVSGAYQIVSIEIKEELLEKDSREMLQDMIAVAVNSALTSAKKDREGKMGEITQGVKVPGVF